jgi:hypothetical protein
LKIIIFGKRLHVNFQSLGYVLPIAASNPVLKPEAASRISDECWLFASVSTKVLIYPLIRVIVIEKNKFRDFTEFVEIFRVLGHWYGDISILPEDVVTEVNLYGDLRPS